MSEFPAYAPPPGVSGETIARAKALARANPGMSFFDALGQVRGTEPSPAAARMAERMVREAVATKAAAQAADRYAARTNAALGRAKQIRVEAGGTVSFAQSLASAMTEAAVSAHAPGGVAERAQRLMSAQPGLSFDAAMRQARDALTVERLKAEARAAR